MNWNQLRCRSLRARWPTAPSSVRALIQCALAPAQCRPSSFRQQFCPLLLLHSFAWNRRRWKQSC